MTNIETRIEGSEKLVGIFGYWPALDVKERLIQVRDDVFDVFDADG